MTESNTGECATRLPSEVIDEHARLSGDEDTGVSVHCTRKCIHERGGLPIIYHPGLVNHYEGNPEVECVTTLTGLSAAFERHLLATHAATWSLVCGPSPYARAVEPDRIGIAIPEEIIDWADQTAREHDYKGGYSPEEPDLYLLVTPAAEAGEVAGEVAYVTRLMPDDDLALLRRAVEASFEQDVHDEP